MEVRNCKNCGKLYNYMGGAPICQSCINALEEKYTEVKKYIYDNPGASIHQVAEENDVTTNQIQKWIREERLTFAEGSGVGIDCERCGTSIRTGRFCKSCKDKMANNLGRLYEEPTVPKTELEKKNSNKMRFL